VHFARVNFKTLLALFLGTHWWCTWCNLAPYLACKRCTQVVYTYFMLSCLFIALKSCSRCWLLYLQFKFHTRSTPFLWGNVTKGVFHLVTHVDTNIVLIFLGIQEITKTERYLCRFESWNGMHRKSNKRKWIEMNWKF